MKVKACTWAPEFNLLKGICVVSNVKSCSFTAQAMWLQPAWSSEENQSCFGSSKWGKQLDSAQRQFLFAAASPLSRSFLVVPPSRPRSAFLRRLTLGVLLACVHTLLLAGPLRHSRAWRKERQVKDGGTRAPVRRPAQLGAQVSSACTHSGWDSKTQQWNNVRAVKVPLKRVRHLSPTLTDFSQCLATERKCNCHRISPRRFQSEVIK